MERRNVVILRHYRQCSKSESSQSVVVGAYPRPGRPLSANTVSADRPCDLRCAITWGEAVTTASSGECEHVTWAFRNVSVQGGVDTVQQFQQETASAALEPINVVPFQHSQGLPPWLFLPFLHTMGKLPRSTRDCALGLAGACTHSVLLELGTALQTCACTEQRSPLDSRYCSSPSASVVVAVRGFHCEARAAESSFVGTT